MREEQIERAIDACYDAIFTPKTWPEALHALSRSFGAVGCRIRGPSGNAILALPMSPDLREFVAEFGRDGWWRSDYRSQRGWPLFASGTRVLVDHEIASHEERRRLPLLNELSRRHDLPWWAAVAFPANGSTWCLSFFRNGRRGPFERSDARRLADLRPHLARLMRLTEQLALGRAQVQLDLLDGLACAALLIDWKGVVIRTNARAEELMGAELRICRGALTAADATSNRRLQNLVQQLRTMAPSRGGRPPERVFILRDGQAPLVIEPLPVAGLAADAFRSARAVLVITDLEARQAPPEETLRRAFGLTAAEARLASELASGGSLDDAADRLGKAKETARSQLKAIFAKTDTSRQAELVALLSGLARVGLRDSHH